MRAGGPVKIIFMGVKLVMQLFNSFKTSIRTNHQESKEEMMNLYLQYNFKNLYNYDL